MFQMPRRIRTCSSVLMTLCLTVILSACSTTPVAVLQPPASAMIKSEPPPLLPEPDARVSDLVAADLQLVQQYRTLARRHDALVTWVGEIVQKSHECALAGR